MYKYIFSFIFVPILCLTLAMPVQASHGHGNGNHNNNGRVHFNQLNSNQQSNWLYQHQTSSVELARLYALIAQLQAQLAALQGYSLVHSSNQHSGTKSSSEITRVTTGSVAGDGDDSVEFDGSVTFRRDSEARVWFEYGTTLKLSYSTESIKIDGDSGDTENFEISTSDIDDNDIYYFRAVAEDDNGRFVEGVIKSFRFDGRNNDNDNDEDWSLEVEADYYETGETIRVYYEVDDRDNDNYIALFEAGDDDDDYIRRVFVDDEDGYVTFRIYDEGEYEFRLFDEDEDVQAESDEFEVED